MPRKHTRFASGRGIRELPGGKYEIRVVEVRPANDRDNQLFKAHRLSTEAAALREAGKYDDAIARAEMAIASAEKALDPDDAYIGVLNTQLSSLWWYKGDLTRAKTLPTTRSRLRVIHPGPNDPQTARASTLLPSSIALVMKGRRPRRRSTRSLKSRRERKAKITPPL